MTLTKLTDGWTLELVDGPSDAPESLRGKTIPASVPGCVHTDLLAAEVISDPYVDDAEHHLHWIGWSDWRYRTTFRASSASPSSAPGEAQAPGERVDLAFDGLDTVATITVNGVEVGRTFNMHRRYRFDITELLRHDEDNELVVHFTSPEKYAAAEMERQGGPYPCAEGRPYSFIRKMACNFKWDWGPDLLTSGIWRAVSLHTWRSARLAEVRPQVTVEGTTVDGADVGGAVGRVGKVRIPVKVERHDDDGPLTLRATVAGVMVTGELAVGETETELELTVPDPDLWWPHGYGGQPLYELTVEVSGASAQPSDSWRKRIGFRSLVLDTAPDEIGSPFTFVINGRRIFANGVNWIPDDCFPSRIGRARYAARLTQALDANVNLVRVWGGGIFESDAFYDVCDELGMLAWQDFLFACAAYNEEALSEEVEAEARDNVARLSPHPSLVLWNANNETIWGFVEGDWSEVGDRTWGLGFYLELLPRVVAELDQTRPFWGGSPYSGTMDLDPNDPNHGLMHVWDVWNDVDYPVYRTHTPRFASEFGFQGPATYATLARAVTERPPAPDSPGMLNRQRAANGVHKLTTGLAAHFEVPTDFDDWHYVTQINQARALATGIEYFRSLQPHCMGTAWWQFNDCWPVHSWAVVDGDGRKKPAWYAMRKAYAPQLLTIQPGIPGEPDSGGLRLVALNTTSEPWQERLRIERVGFDGSVLSYEEQELSVLPYDKNEIEIPRSIAEPGDRRTELVRARTFGGAESTWYFATDKELDYPTGKVDVAIGESCGETTISVSALSFVRDLCVFADRLEPTAETDRALVTLLPGETATFTVNRTGLPAEELETSPVLRAVNL